MIVVERGDLGIVYEEEREGLCEDRGEDSCKLLNTTSEAKIGQESGSQTCRIGREMIRSVGPGE